LPIPENQGDSVVTNFISPLLEDKGFNSIVIITDHLGGANLWVIPTRTDVSAQDLVTLFFDNWYCENRLPLEIVSDRDKLFTSKFWTALHSLTGIKLKMSTSYHPQTDSASEHTNKTVNQALHFYVQQN
jgi:hypothetical protein